MDDDDLEGGSVDSVAELFETAEAKHTGSNPLRQLTRAERKQAFDAIERDISGHPDRLPGSPRFERGIATWTVGTLALALLASLILGFESITTGVATTAYGAGLLSGGSGLVLGFALLRVSTG